MSTPYISISEQFLDKVLAIVKAAIYGYIVYVFIEAVRKVLYQQIELQYRPKKQEKMTQRVGSHFWQTTNPGALTPKSSALPVPGTPCLRETLS